MLAFALLAAGPTIGPAKSFGDWYVACDNVRTCEMTSLAVEGKWPEDGPPVVALTREAGPRGAFAMSIDIGKASGRLSLRVDGVVVAQGTAAGGVLRFRDAEAARIAAAASNGTVLTVGHAEHQLLSVSLAGSSAALRFIDAEQGRAGTVTAAVARGGRPAAGVPAAPAIPRIAALASTGTPARISAAMRKRMDTSSDCGQWQPDPPYPATTVALGGGATLALLPCGDGAYNRNSAAFIIRGGKEAVADIDHVDDDAGGGIDMLTNARWDPQTRLLSTHAKSRGLGDCGEAASYAWDGRRFRLVELRVMRECRGSINWLRVWRAEPVFR